MTEHRGPDHKGVMRDCIQEIHWCWDKYGEGEPMTTHNPALLPEPKWAKATKAVRGKGKIPKAELLARLSRLHIAREVIEQEIRECTEAYIAK